MRCSLFIVFIFLACGSYSQERQWCFGDSAGLVFNQSGGLATFTSAMKSRGSCSNICDSSGNLLFYTAYDPIGTLGGSPLNGNVYNRNHQIMLNGDGIDYNYWFQEVVIVPFPGNANQYYIFSVGVSQATGLFYSVVDMTMDNGLGAVIQKNVLLQNSAAYDAILAVQHGNGRDWWIFYRKSGVDTGIPNNTFYRYLLDVNGVNGPFTQSIGPSMIANLIRYTLNKDANKLIAATDGMLEIFDFDRCSGLLSNQRVIQDYTQTPTYTQGYYAEFSPSSQFVYVATGSYQQLGLIMQFNLMDTNPLLSADTIYQFTTPMASGSLRRAINDKIYWACTYHTTFGLSFPYPDTLFNFINSNISVINHPDSLGAACDIQPFSINLGGSRTYGGLPNNPNRFLGPLDGSICDSLTVAISELSNDYNVSVFPNPIQDRFYIGFDPSRFQLKTVLLFNSMGIEYQVDYSSYKGDNMLEIDCSGLPTGTYFVKLVSEEKEVVCRKIVKL